MMAELPTGEAYALARAEMERKILSALGRQRRELGSRLARESGRAAAYYDELGRELQEQWQTFLPAIPGEGHWSRSSGPSAWSGKAGSPSSGASTASRQRWPCSASFVSICPGSSSPGG